MGHHKLSQVLLLIAVTLSPSYCENLKYVSTIARLPHASLYGTVVSDGQDSIYVIGGYGRDGTRDEVVKYSIESGSVGVVGHLPRETEEGVAFMDGDDIVYFAGTGERNTGSLYRISTKNGSVAAEGDKLPSPFSHTAIAYDAPNRTAYTFGGLGGRPLNEVFRYDLRTGKPFEQVMHLPSRRWGAGAVWDERRQVAVIFGGYTDDADPLTTDILEYDPVRNEVTTLPAKFPVSGWMNGVAYVGATGNVFLAREQLFRYSTRTGMAESLEVDDWPLGLVAPCVYVPKLGRLYLVGGIAPMEGLRDQIGYIDLDRKSSARVDDE